VIGRQVREKIYYWTKDYCVETIQQEYTLSATKKRHYEMRAGKTFLNLTSFIENISNIYITK
jgi:hypothetical protein